MVGPRVGLRVGPRVGPAVGVGADELANPTSGTPQTTLTVVLADSADPVITQVNYNYTVVVTNTGAVDATNVVCDVNLDPQSTFVSGSGVGWTVTNMGLGLIRSTRALLAAGAAPTITITVTSPSAAETSSATADADADNSPPATQDTETTVVNLVDRDATSGIRVPSSATQWTNFLAFNALAIGNPNSLYLLQEASGNPADSIDALPLVVGGAPTYQQAVAGWSRLAIAFADGTSDKAVLASGSGPNPTTTSQLWCFFMLMPATPAANRVFLGVNTATAATRCVAIHLSVSGGIRANVVTVNTDDTTSHSAQVIACVVQYDRSGAGKANVYTNLIKVVGTYSAGVLDGDKGLGSTAVSMDGVKALYGYRFDGAGAEMSVASVKSLLQAHGFTIPWS